jgi:hypothetical protein
VATLKTRLNAVEGRVFLAVDTRSVDLADVDADQVAAGNVILAFVVPGPQGDHIEIVWRTQ